jgi:hypothetical protein
MFAPKSSKPPKLDPKERERLAIRSKASVPLRNKLRSAVAAATAPQGGAARIIDHYEVLETVHRSVRAELCVSRHRRTGELVVLKAIDKAGARVPCTAAACYHAKIQHEHACVLHEVRALLTRVCSELMPLPVLVTLAARAPRSLTRTS